MISRIWCLVSSTIIWGKSLRLNEVDLDSESRMDVEFRSASLKIVSAKLHLDLTSIETSPYGVCT